MSGRIVTIVVLAALVGSASAQVADHAKCYKIKDPLLLHGVVDLDSPDVGLSAGCRISKAMLYCVPVTKQVVSAANGSTPITPLVVQGPNPGDRICYKINCGTSTLAPRELTDQFGDRTVALKNAQLLCVPAVQGPPPAPASTVGAVTNLDAPSEFNSDCNAAAGYHPSGF